MVKSMPELWLRNPEGVDLMAAKLLLQISDCHWMPQAGGLFRDQDPEAQLKALVAQLLDEAIYPDLLVLTGDLVHHGAAERYQALLAVLAALPCPKIWLPGNHDDRTAMQEVERKAPAELSRTRCLLGAWQLVCLDSTYAADGRGAGYLSPESWQVLAEIRSEPQQMPVLLMLHHHPLPTGTDWQDAIMLQDAELLWAYLQEAPRVKGLICGHLHRALYWQHQGVEVWSAPSTALQFSPACGHAEVEHLLPESLPGVSLYHLYDDGRIECEVRRLASAWHDAPQG